VSALASPRGGRGARPGARPRVAVWKFASCDGCQLSVLSLDRDLLTLAREVEIASFPEASSAAAPGPYDLSLVEGSITTPEDERRIRRVRRESRALVTIGACATAGGVQALRNFVDVRELASVVYARPDYLRTLARSTPVAEHVRVDFELRGCPVDVRQLTEVLSAYLAGRRPQIEEHSVCVECKRAGRVCVMVAHGTPCLGPVTHAGCGALCPAYDRGCYGCYGPAETANTASLAEGWRALGASDRELVRAFRGVQAWAEPFREESRRIEDAP